MFITLAAMCIGLEVFPTQRDRPNSCRQRAPLPVPVYLLVQSSSPHQQISLQRAQQTCEHSPQPCQPTVLSITTLFLLLPLFFLELKLLCIPPPLPVPWTVLSQLQTMSPDVSSTRSHCAATKPHPFFSCWQHQERRQQHYQGLTSPASSRNRTILSSSADPRRESSKA